MERIYLIEDCNNLKYVGRTKIKLKYRLSGHKCNKKRNRGCSSEKLDLDKCTITCLDIADSKEEARELEEFYINSIDCVNHYKGNFDQKQYRENHKQEKKEYDKKYQKQIYHYQKTWGGNKRSNNNLLEIDPDMFNY